MTKQKTTAARSKVCAFRLTPAMHKKVVAKLKVINGPWSPHAPLKAVYGPADFFHAATLALLADTPEVCREWLADLERLP